MKNKITEAQANKIGWTTLSGFLFDRQEGDKILLRMSEIQKLDLDQYEDWIEVLAECKCGARLIGRNAQDVGMCLDCFAEEQND